jgi:predicted regulator of Ras-like GTPase activity (Roadblock/LC7/MglB family)
VIKAEQMLSETQKQDLIAYCTKLLKEFCAKTDGVQSATFATFDGVTVASTIQGKTEGDKVAAMSSSISALAAALTREVKHPEPDRVLLESEHGRIVFIKVPAANAGIVFTAVTDHNTVLGTLLWNCRSTTERLASYAAKFLN